MGLIKSLYNTGAGPAAVAWFNQQALEKPPAPLQVTSHNLQSD